MFICEISNAFILYIMLYRDVQKATQNFTTILGEGSFGPVYKATMPTGGVAAIKVLASGSHQGEKEFHTEVSSTNHSKSGLPLFRG